MKLYRFVVFCAVVLALLFSISIFSFAASDFSYYFGDYSFTDIDDVEYNNFNADKDRILVFFTMKDTDAYLELDDILMNDQISMDNDIEVIAIEYSDRNVDNLRSYRDTYALEGINFCSVNNESEEESIVDKLRSKMKSSTGDSLLIAILDKGSNVRFIYEDYVNPDILIEDIISDDTLLTIPDKLETNVSEEGTLITWDNVTNAESYVICKSTDGISFEEYDTTRQNYYLDVSGDAAFYKIQAVKSYEHKDVRSGLSETVTNN